jgi:hypothetical protein
LRIRSVVMVMDSFRMMLATPRRAEALINSTP